MIRAAILATALLASIPASAAKVLFPDVAIASIRANHPEFSSNPIMVTCRGPWRTMTFRGEPWVPQPHGEVVSRLVIDDRCDDPWHHAVGAIEPFRGHGR